MRLVDLSPRWLEHRGERIAIMFRCPHCVRSGNQSGDWLTCFFKAAGDLPAVPQDYPIEEMRGCRGERALFYEALREMGHPDPVDGCYSDVVDCKPTCAWKRTSDDFGSMSVTPSIDASAAGHWHGYITAGEIR